MAVPGRLRAGESARDAISDRNVDAKAWILIVTAGRPRCRNKQKSGGACPPPRPEGARGAFAFLFVAQAPFPEECDRLRRIDVGSGLHTYVELSA